MTTDYTPGDPPVPVDTIVDYEDRGRCKVIAHENPEQHRNRLTLPADLTPYYPDGVAYTLWLEDVPLGMDNHWACTMWVRRTSFRIIEPPQEGTT